MTQPGHDRATQPVRLCEGWGVGGNNIFKRGPDVGGARDTWELKLRRFRS